MAIVSVRNGLQKLKHADTGADTERDEMLKYLRAVEGFLTVALRVSWAHLSHEQVDQLRVRLAA